LTYQKRGFETPGFREISYEIHAQLHRNHAFPHKILREWTQIRKTKKGLVLQQEMPLVSPTHPGPVPPSAEEDLNGFGCYTTFSGIGPFFNLAIPGLRNLHCLNA